MAYDPSTPLGYTRLLIADTDETDPIFTDAEITAFLNKGSNDPYQAAATAYGTILRSKSLLAKRVKREGYESEEYAIADLRAILADLQNQNINPNGLVTVDFAANDNQLESWRPEWRETTGAVIVE